ncbi:hypothetical protein [Daejeonella sp.]|uniref:hypothetical protein n=1 Tax=Daejeonella sp. TaxID=2805397 RepID=UPI0030BB53BF
MKRIKIFALALLFLSACQKKQDSFSPAESDLTLKVYSEITNKALLLKTAQGVVLQMSTSKNINGTQVSRPLTSSGSGTISYIPNGCGTGTFKFQSVGTGHSSHLGRQEQTTSFCIDGATGQIISPVVGVGTAANGDELYYTFLGTGIDTATGFVYQDYIFSGGTGRFANATGSVRLLYSVNNSTSYEYTGTGTITY